jgi:hypothetical protein
VAPLLGMAKLKSLNLYANEIVSVTGLGGLSKLETLNLGSNHITSIQPLSGMLSLSNLGVASNPVTSIAPVSTLATLTALNIGNDNVSDLAPVAGLHNLEVLHAYGNRISDLTPLSGIASLDQVYLTDNDVSDISPLVGLSLSYAGLYNNWLYLVPGSPARSDLDALLAKGCAVEYEPQKAGGVFTGTARAAVGGVLGGVKVSVTGGPRAVTSPNGMFVAGLVQPGVRAVTFSKPFYASYVTTVSVAADTTYSVNATLTPLQLPPTIKRSPTGSSRTYRRKHGVARYTFSAVLSDARGLMKGKTVYLQHRRPGGKWHTAYKLTTDSSGKVAHRFVTRKKGTAYYRWYSKASAYSKSKTTSSQKVVVK